jgi:uncharacterized protein (DUF305 family)
MPVGRRPFAYMVIVAACTTALAACGTDGVDRSSAVPTTRATASPTPTATPATTAAPTISIPPATGPHNDVDVIFSTDMIPHHRQAVEMAVLASTKASDPRIKEMAARIRQAQDAEIALMVSWLKRWREPVPPPDQLHTAHGPGMMTHAEMEDLKAASGPDFDRMFCDMMVRHHEGALEMATITSTEGQNQAVRALAQRIVVSQTAEVAELNAILDTL